MQSLRWMMVIGLAVCLTPLPGVRAQNQHPVQPVSPSAPVAPTSPAAGTSATKHGNTKHNHANDFVIIGTVFNDKALSFPGVQLRVRRAGEKKFRWDTCTNSRGEFAVRVPRGAQYEIAIHAKGFADQSRKVDTTAGDSEERISIRMEAATGGKK
jgi:Carboxypeptidase regulatory-like domain